MVATIQKPYLMLIFIAKLQIQKNHICILMLYSQTEKLGLEINIKLI